MTDDQTPADSSEKAAEHPKVLEDHERLIHYGVLLPGLPTQYCDVNFTIDDVKAALLDSTYSKPKYLEFVLDQHQTGSELMHVAVSAVQAVYASFEQGLGCFQTPDFLVYGWLPKSGYDPYPEIVRVRCYLFMEADNHDVDRAIVQHLPASQTTWGIDYFNNPPPD